ncbi:MAG: hypothetical protein AB7T63_05170 [Planctomycetota bacterium]
MARVRRRVAFRMLVALPFVALSLVALGAVVARAEEGPSRPPPSQAYIDMIGTLSPQGDFAFDLSLRPAPERWKLLKVRYNTPELLFRDVVAHHSALETEFPDPVTFDERNLRIRTRMNLLGYAKNLGSGKWMVDLELEEGQTVRGFERKESEGGTTLLWVVDQTNDELALEMTFGVRLPEAAKDIQVDEKAGVFRYHLDRPEGEGRPRLATALRVKPRILTGAYKAYALADAAPDHWLAKAVVRNTGPSVVHNLRIRFQIPGFADWGLWTKFPELVPGQTVIAPYHPVLDAKIAQLQSKTPANIMYEFTYEDAGGKEYKDSDGARATLLGGHEFYFSSYQTGEYLADNFYEVMTQNSDLLAAWVSREDPVVDQFAAMANRLAGGAPSGLDPNAARKTLHAIYELWVRNDFVYVTPSGLQDRSLSFDPKSLQNIKYPRDVIRDKAGTCIDTAILYAAMGASLGLDPYLLIVPGHCLPVFLLPAERGSTERKWLPIESTGIRGGLGEGYRSWEHVQERGAQQLVAVFQGQMPGKLVDVKQLWAHGVTGPELPELPADILERWKISEGSGPILTAGDGAGGGADAGPGGETQADPAAPILGRWSGQQTHHLPNGRLVAPATLVIARNEQGQLAWEGLALATIAGVGRLQTAAAGSIEVRGNQLVFHILQSVTRNLDTGAAEQGESGSVTLVFDGKRLTGRDTSEGYAVDFVFSKQ